jgi:sugar phosphate isomerase/epimerase
MDFSVRVSFPENEKYDWIEAMKIFERVGFIETAFFNSDLFLKVDVGKIVKPFAQLNIKVSSLHFAQFSLVNLDLFARVFHKTIRIAMSLDCDSIVIHPSMGRLKAIANFLEKKIDPVLEKEKIYFCWETFESKRRIFGGLENLANYCRNTQYHRICYDFSHIHKNQQEILEDLEKYLGLIRVFHRSNRIKGSIKQHYPVYYTQEDVALNFDEILTFLKQKNFNGHLVLEYLPQFHSQLLQDALTLKSVYKQN